MDTFESLLLQDTILDHILPTVYRALILKAYPHLPEYTNMWTLDLNVQIKLEEWKKAFTLTHCMSLATWAQEMDFKLLSRCYRCLTLLQMYTQMFQLYWRCHAAKVLLLHIWMGMSIYP